MKNGRRQDIHFKISIDVWSLTGQTCWRRGGQRQGMRGNIYVFFSHKDVRAQIVGVDEKRTYISGDEFIWLMVRKKSELDDGWGWLSRDVREHSVAHLSSTVLVQNLYFSIGRSEYFDELRRNDNTIDILAVIMSPSNLLWCVGVASSIGSHRKC